MPFLQLDACLPRCSPDNVAGVIGGMIVEPVEGEHSSVLAQGGNLGVDQCRAGIGGQENGDCRRVRGIHRSPSVVCRRSRAMCRMMVALTLTACKRTVS